MWHSKEQRTERGPVPTSSGALSSEKRLQDMLFVCPWTSLGWFYILAQMQIPEWMVCKRAWMHQERVFGKEPCLQWAVWQSKYLLKDKLMTVSCKCRQIHYWNASQYFGLVLSKNKSQSSNTSACVCGCVTLLPKVKGVSKVGKSLSPFSWNIWTEFNVLLWPVAACC